MKRTMNSRIPCFDNLKLGLEGNHIDDYLTQALLAEHDLKNALFHHYFNRVMRILDPFSSCGCPGEGRRRSSSLQQCAIGFDESRRELCYFVGLCVAVRIPQAAFLDTDNHSNVDGHGGPRNSDKHNHEDEEHKDKADADGVQLCA